MHNDQGQRPMPENPGRLLPFLPYFPIRQTVSIAFELCPVLDILEAMSTIATP
jgi:hypothetical protein